jgi:hypothetical protein
MSAPNSVISGGNLLNTKTAFPNSTLVADEEASGHEAYRIATGRRSPYTNYYTAITANAQRTLTLTCDRERAADLFVLDRGHNLLGKELILERSYTADFSSAIPVFDVVLPTSVATLSLDDAFGVVTEEGAWLIRFLKVSAPYWRIRIPALGANVRPKIVGAHLSASFAFDPWRPTAPDQTEAGGDMAESDAGWQAVAAPWLRRSDTLRIQLQTPFDYELAATAFRHWDLRRPCWFVPDETYAQTARCIWRPNGVAGFARDVDWFPHKAAIPAIEFEAA